MEPQGGIKDFDFSRSTMEARWRQGLADANIALQASPWLEPMPSELGVRVFDVMHEILARTNSAKLEAGVVSRQRKANHASAKL
jgi:NTE family protein